MDMDDYFGEYYSDSFPSGGEEEVTALHEAVVPLNEEIEQKYDEPQDFVSQEPQSQSTSKSSSLPFINSQKEILEHIIYFLLIVLVITQVLLVYMSMKVLSYSTAAAAPLKIEQ
jgi:hypothetical protein